MLLHSPPLAAGWSAFLGAVRRDLSLPPRLVELVTCAVAALNGAEYQWEQHAHLFLAAAAADDARDGATAEGAEGGGASAPAGAADAASACDRAALALAAEMTRGPRVRDATFAAARAALGSDRGALELVGVAAAYNMVSRLLLATGVGPEGRA